MSMYKKSIWCKYSWFINEMKSFNFREIKVKNDGNRVAGGGMFLVYDQL